MSTGYPFKLAAWGIALTLVALPILGVLNGWFAGDRWPVTRLDVSARFDHVSAEQIRAAAQPLLDQLGLHWDEVAAIGDDWPDLPLLTRAAFACAPANAHLEVKAVAHHVTTARGGHGAARECCDLLLTAAGRYADALRDHLVTLDVGTEP